MREERTKKDITTKRELGNFEETQVFTNEHYPFNAVIVLCLANGPSEKELKRVLAMLFSYHPELGVHVVKEKGRYFFVTGGTPEIPLKMIQRENDNHWKEVAESELNTGIDLFSELPVRVSYLMGTSSDGNESELIFTLQHSIMDATSASNLLHEILALCELVESGELPDAVESKGLMPPAEAFFPPKVSGIKRFTGNSLFMMRQMADEMSFKFKSMGKRKPVVHKEGKCKIMTMSLTEELTAELCKTARKKRMTLNNILNTAMLLAVQKHIYEGHGLPLRHFNFADLRPYLVPQVDPECLGSYFSMMRFTFPIPENAEFWPLVDKVSDISYKALKRNDKFHANLMSPGMMRMMIRFKAFRMAASALSYTGPLLIAEEYGKVTVRSVHAFVSNFVLGPEYTAHARIFDGMLWWDILYMDSDMNHEQAGVIADEIKDILELAVKED